MFANVRTVLVEIARQAPTVLVLGALAAAGFWGHTHHWKLPSFASLTGKEGEKSEKTAGDDDAKAAPLVVLASDEAADKAGLEHAPVRTESVKEDVEAPAVLDFVHGKYVQLAPRASGTAWDVSVSEGENVEEGKTLALIAAPELGSAKAEFLSAHIQYEVRLKTLQRLQNIGDAVPDRQVREAELYLREAKVRLVNGQQALVNLSLKLHLKDLENLTDTDIARKVRELGLEKYLRYKRDKLGLSTYPVSEEDLPGNLLPVDAPFKGRVIRRNIVTGEVVSPQQPAFVIADLSKLWVQMDLRLEDVGRLARDLGQEVVFQAKATQQSATGKLIWISAEVDPKTRTVRARAEIDNPGERFRPATFGKARIVVSRKDKALTVLNSALQWTDGSHRVFVRLNDKTYDPRLAVVGAQKEDRSELLDARMLQGPALAGSFAITLGPLPWLPGLAALPTTRRLLQDVRAGEHVVTTGSHVIMSEMLKHRIGGEE